MSNERQGLAGVLLHPVVLGALAVWLINDHWGKAAHGGLVTGKLSDVASLIVFPLIPVVALALWRQRRGGPPPGRAWIGFWLIATGLVMATINLFDPAAWAYSHGLAAAQWPFRAVWHLAAAGDLPRLSAVHLTMDPTDLLTLPALLVPWVLCQNQRQSSRAGAASPHGSVSLHTRALPRAHAGGGSGLRRAPGPVG